jgi:hypothetical protein
VPLFFVISNEYQQHPHALDDHVADYLEEYSNSGLQTLINHRIKKEEETDREIVVKGYFPSSETNIDIQQYFKQNEVFQSCLSSPENDVVVQFLNGLDTDEGFENASMGTLDCEIVRDIISSHSQEDYEQEFISIQSFESKMEILKQISKSLIKPNQNCLMNKRMHIIWLSHLKAFKNV